jgi:hypothetical protein
MRYSMLTLLFSIYIVTVTTAADFLPLTEKYEGQVCVLCENPLTIHAGKLYALGNHKLQVEQADAAARKGDISSDLAAQLVIVDNIHFEDGKLGFDFLDLRTKQRRVGYVAVDTTGDLRLIAEAKLAASFKASRLQSRSPVGDTEADISKLRFEWLDAGKPSGKFLATATEPSALTAVKHDPGALKFVLGLEKDAAEIVGYQYLSDK